MSRLRLRSCFKTRVLAWYGLRTARLSGVLKQGLRAFSAHGPLDFAERDNALGDELIAALLKPLKLLSGQDVLDVRRRRSLQNHIAKIVGDAQQFEESPSPGKAGAKAARAAGGVVDFGDRLADQTHRLPLFGRDFDGTLAVLAELSDQALREDDVQALRNQVRLDAEIEQAEDRADGVFGVNGGETPGGR